MQTLLLRCRTVQEQFLAKCDIFIRHYGAPCGAITTGYCILCLPTALCNDRGILNTLSTPPSEGTSIPSTSSTSPSG
eukprot:1029786-Ditylum_brightwellii.AAC.1